MIEYTQAKMRGQAANRKAFAAMEETPTAAWLFDDAGICEVEASEEREPAGPIPVRQDGRPDPQWVRGRCPECGDELVSSMYYVGGQGYLCVWECWGARGENAQCSYRRVL